MAFKVGRPPGSKELMSQTAEIPAPAPNRDPRAVQILAKNIYREFRAGGFSERDVLALAGELLSLVTKEVRGDAAER
jgi:hypothetical protein